MSNRVGFTETMTEKNT